MYSKEIKHIRSTKSLIKAYLLRKHDCLLMTFSKWRKILAPQGCKCNKRNVLVITISPRFWGKQWGYQNICLLTFTSGRQLCWACRHSAVEVTNYQHPFPVCKQCWGQNDWRLHVLISWNQIRVLEAVWVIFGDHPSVYLRGNTEWMESLTSTYVSSNLVRGSSLKLGRPQSS